MNKVESVDDILQELQDMLAGLHPQNPTESRMLNEIASGIETLFHMIEELEFTSSSLLRFEAQVQHLVDALGCDPTTFVWLSLAKETQGREPTDSELAELAPFMMMRTR